MTKKFFWKCDIQFRNALKMRNKRRVQLNLLILMPPVTPILMNAKHGWHMRKSEQGSRLEKRTVHNIIMFWFWHIIHGFFQNIKSGKCRIAMVIMIPAVIEYMCLPLLIRYMIKHHVVSIILWIQKLNGHSSKYLV